MISARLCPVTGRPIFQSWLYSCANLADGLRTQMQKGWRSAEALERKGRADAAAIIELCAGGWVARDAAIVRLGWTSDAAGRQRWESADALLLRAGVIARNHRTTTILATGAEALTLLDKAVQ